MIESQNTFVCERAIFGVFNSFTVKKVNFFTINVKFKVILSSKSGGGGGYLYRPSPTQKVGGIHPPGFTPVIGSLAILFLAILLHNVCFLLHLSLDR